MSEIMESKTIRNWPLVSVIITTCGRDVAYVRESLESALAQTYQRIEVIVVDDNGLDGPLSHSIERLCLAYERVVYIANAKNMGAQYSRNIGVISSTGEFVAFLDDDDLWVPEKLERQLAFFDDPSVGMVYCDGYSFADDDINNTGTFREASLFSRPITQDLELFNDYIGSTSQALIKRECFAAVGLFDSDMPARQDYEMWLRICGRYKVVGSSEKLLYYRIHSGGRISTNWEKCLESYRLILTKYGKEYSKNKYAKAKLMLRAAAFSKKAGHSLVSMEYLIGAFCTNPACVFDVIARRVKGQSFSRFYNEEKLSHIFNNIY